MKTTFAMLVMRTHVWAYMYSESPNSLLNIFEQMHMKGKACKVMVF